jgi:hypothetical protein
MGIDRNRRSIVLGSAAALFGAALPACASAPPGVPALLGAWRAGGQDYAGVWSEDAPLRAIALPFRAHQVLADPARAGSAVAIARRPGELIARLDLQRVRIETLRMIDAQYVTNGHGAFTADAKGLLVAENDAVTGEGFLTFYDADSLECVGRTPTHGIGPHAVLRNADGSLLVANGGVLTQAQTGRTPLNADGIASSLVHLDTQGRLLGSWRLEEQDLSIRHLARAADGTIGVALQAQRTSGVEQAPVLAVFDGHTLRLAEPTDVALGGYGGDVACIDTAAGSFFAVGCTHGNRVALWAAGGTFVASHLLAKACAVAACNGRLIAPSERGELGVLPGTSGSWHVTHAVPAWDNHVAPWTA